MNVDQAIRRIEQRHFRTLTGIKTARLIGSKRLTVKPSAMLSEAQRDTLLTYVHQAQRVAKVKARLQGCIAGAEFLEAYDELFRVELERLLA